MWLKKKKFKVEGKVIEGKQIFLPSLTLNFLESLPEAVSYVSPVCYMSLQGCFMFSLVHVSAVTLLVHKWEQPLYIVIPFPLFLLNSLEAVPYLNMYISKILFNDSIVF